MYTKTSLLYACCIATLCALALINYNLLTNGRRKLRKNVPRKDIYPWLASNEWQQLNMLSEQRNLLMRKFPEHNSTLPPIRSLVISSWRSGSTFLGDILNSMAGNYYHYEPLLHKGIVQIRGDQSEVAAEAIHHIEKLLKCNYMDMDSYMQHAQHSELFSQNTQLWTHCHPFCFDPMFVQRFCALFPMQSMKLVRLRLSLLEPILADLSLNVRLVYLVRDPRAIMESRKRRPWCQHSSDCNDPKKVCNDLRQDYETAQRFVEKYPTRFRVFHYEKLALSPYNVTKDILRFYGRNYTATVKEFLNVHTQKNFPNKENTFRRSAAVPLQWMSHMKSREIIMIQTKCLTALRLWQYKIIERGQRMDRNYKKQFYQFDN